MNLETVKSDLFEFFITHETFSIEENFNDLYILTDKKEKPLKVGLINKVLEEFSEQGVLVKIEHEGKETWVLKKPLIKYNQPVDLSYVTIANLTQLINRYCEETKNKDAVVDPMHITERDIQNLILIVHQILKGNEA